MIGGIALIGFAIYRNRKMKAAAPSNSQGAFTGAVTDTSGGGTVALGLDAGQVSQPVVASSASPSAVGVQSPAGDGAMKYGAVPSVRDSGVYDFESFF